MFKIYQTLHSEEYSRKLIHAITLIAILTWVHHIYGGLIYDTPYRIIAPSISLPILLSGTFYLQYLLIKKGNTLLKRLYMTIVCGLWILSISLVEGFYNHVLKNVLFFSGVTYEKLSVMFPPEFGELSFFELPSDIFFEVTGIVQFFIGLTISHHLIKFLKSSSHVLI